MVYTGNCLGAGTASSTLRVMCAASCGRAKAKNKTEQRCCRREVPPQQHFGLSPHFFSLFKGAPFRLFLLFLLCSLTVEPL